MTESNLRYSRQIAVAEIGREGQEKISNSKVLVVGSGALGSVAAMQLAGAGIGTLGIADFDRIDISNLQRQFFYSSDEAGEPKVKVLSKKITALNPEIEVKVFEEIITPKKASSVFSDFDFIIDATDNPESKNMIIEFSRKLGKGCCVGGVRDFWGQVMSVLPTDSSMEEFFGSASSAYILPCSLAGVMGPAAAFCASIQVSEAIKYITSTGELLSGRMFLFNLLTNYYKVISL